MYYIPIVRNTQSFLSSPCYDMGAFLRNSGAIKGLGPLVGPASKASTSSPIVSKAKKTSGKKSKTILGGRLGVDENVNRNILGI